MKQALEALEAHADIGIKSDKAIDSLRQAIEQVEKQEPVAWMWQHDETGRTGFIDMWQLENGWEKINPRLLLVCPLYTAPPNPEWVGLTDDDIDEILIDLMRQHAHGAISIARAVEAKLKEKNHG
jgi:hypothetical protein